MQCFIVNLHFQQRLLSLPGAEATLFVHWKRNDAYITPRNHTIRICYLTQLTKRFLLNRSDYPSTKQQMKTLAKTIIPCALATIGSTAAAVPRTGGGSLSTSEWCPARDDSYTSPMYCPSDLHIYPIIPVQYCSLSKL